MSKGNEAGALLERLSTARVSGEGLTRGRTRDGQGGGCEEGAITYTQWLNREGGIEADLTVTKLPAGFVIRAAF